jgi:hypothetical protein
MQIKVSRPVLVQERGSTLKQGDTDDKPSGAEFASGALQKTRAV